MTTQALPEALPHAPQALPATSAPPDALTGARAALRVLLAVDAFSAEDERVIGAALGTGGTLGRVAQGCPDPEYAAALAEADVVVGWPKPELLLSSPVRLHQLPSVGYDAYLGKGLETKPGFALCNGRGTMSVAVAEHCLALMFALTRNVAAHARDATARRWERRAEHSYTELFDSAVCVFGLGSIGTEIARRCAALGMRVSGVRRSSAQGHEIASPVYALAEARRAVRGADHVVLALPLGEGTAGLVDAALLDAMKPGVRVYNAGRGGLLDEAALVERLRSGHVAGAGLDVFAEEPLPRSSPLWDLENVVITPHAAGQSGATAHRLAELTSDNLLRLRNGKPLCNIVPL